MTNLNPEIKERLDAVITTTKDEYFLKQLLKRPKLLKEFSKIYFGCCPVCKKYINTCVYSNQPTEFEKLCPNCVEKSLPVLEKVVHKLNN